MFKTDSEAFKLFKQSCVEKVVTQKDSSLCSVCGWECSTGIQGWLDHIDSLLGGTHTVQREVKEKTGTHYGQIALECPICNAQKKDVGYLTNHLTEHAKEAHEGTKFCKPCDEKFDSVAAYFQHLETHKK